MDVILKVLEGAKTGAKVAIKKDLFLIGRSPKCDLCAGSTTISRRHCAFRRDGARVTIEDLGSRNGTLVNDEKIAEAVELRSGDEIAVGSLRFLVTITHGINNLKKPKVKSVADAVDRAAAKNDSSIADDDISSWLIGTPAAPSKAANETQTIRMDDTNAIDVSTPIEPELTEESEAAQEASSKNKKPGKLPPVPTEPSSKDSREAAMAALRNFNRRR